MAKINAVEKQYVTRHSLVQYQSSNIYYLVTTYTLRIESIVTLDLHCFSNLFKE